MEANHQSLHHGVSEVKHVTSSNVFVSNAQSKLYQSLHLQNSKSLTHHQNYDSTYGAGFPKLYCFDDGLRGKSRLSLDQKGKYSFRNDYSKILEQNIWLKEEINRLNIIIQTQRRNAVGRGQIERLSAIIYQRQTQIRTLNERIFHLQSQISVRSQWQIKYSQLQTTITQYQTTISQLNSRISTLTQQHSQCGGQINALNIQISQYKQQISQLTIQINQYATTISQLERQPPKPDPQVDILRSQINSLTVKIQQYELQISQYQKTFAQYESQITTLQQVNWKLEERITKLSVPVPAPAPVSVVDNEELIITQGRLNFRIIILLQEINRLKHRQHQLVVKAQQLHAYLLKAQNYIQEIQLQLQKNNLKQNIPTHIVQRVTQLQQQNSRYSLLIQQLHSKLSVVQISGISQQQHYSKLGQRDFRIIILLEQINRLNQKVLELRKYLQDAQDYIELLQKSFQNKQVTVPQSVLTQINHYKTQNHNMTLLIEQYRTQINNLKISQTQYLSQHANTNTLLEQQFAKATLRIIILLQEINRLNHANKEVYGFLVKAEQYIAQLQQRVNQIQQIQTTQIRTTKIQVIPQWMQQQMARMVLQRMILFSQIQRLNHVNSQIRTYLINAQSYIEQNQAKYNQQQTQVTTVIQYRPSPQQQTRLGLLAQQNQRLIREINQMQSRPARIQTRIQHQVQFRIPPEIQSRISLLASQNQRLQQVLVQIRQQLVKAQNYIYEIQNRSQPQAVLPIQVQQQIMNLRQQSQKLHAQINRISIFYQQQIAQYKTQISTINIQLSTYRSQISVYQSKVSQLESQLITISSSGLNDSYQQKWAAQHFRSIILLQQINRLNHKVADIDRERVQVIGHLVNAQNYIQELQIKYSQLEQLNFKQSTITSTTAVTGSATTIQQLSLQIAQLENSRNVEIASRDLRIIFLLEEINRLNHKQRELLAIQGQSHSTEIIINLERQNQQCQIQLQQVLNHLRQAEQYIGQLLRENQGYVAERDQLIQQLNRRR